MARTTPRVEQDHLVLPTGRNAPVQVGSPQWFSWLAEEGNSSFFFANDAGSYTARKERRKRGGWYWIAYRSRAGRLAKTYIGRSEDLTPERLREVTQQLTGQRQADHKRNTSSYPVIAARFTPPPLSTRMSRLLERTALLRCLDESLRVKLTLVTAPAGFGKTILLSQWYEASSRQKRERQTLAWIALSEQDNDPVHFWNAVWSALRRGSGNASFDIAMPLFSTPQMPLESVLASLVNTLNDTAHIVLILDDYHLITNAQIHAGMEFLLSHLPATIHMMITSRSEPPLSLGRARMYGELNELSVDDLRLTKEEVDRFLRDIIGITLSTSEQTLLEQRTEGWLAGLHLAGLALRGPQQPGEVLSRFTGSQRSLFDYFAEEVFSQQTAEVRQFLLSTALLTELSPALCDAMLADTGMQQASGQDLLGYIERANIFVIPLDKSNARYRYHPLFGEFLREKLKRTMPERMALLHEQAISWYEQHDMMEEAIEQALMAQDMPRVQQLLEVNGEALLWQKGELRKLLVWLQCLPPSLRTQNPHLEIVYSWALLLSGQHNLDELENRLLALADQEKTDAGLQGDIIALRARIAGFQDDDQRAAALSLQALQMLPKERKLLRADIAFGLGSSNRDLDDAYRMLSESLHISLAIGSMRPAMFSARYLAAICVQQGKLTEAEAILRQALQTISATHQAHAPLSGVIHIGLAELFYERNELIDAQRHARRGIELGERGGEIKMLLAGHCVQAQIALAQGDVEQSWQEIWKAERIAALGNVVWIGAQIGSIAIRLSLLQNDLSGARRALQKMDFDNGLEYRLTTNHISECIALATVWLAQEKYALVVELLEPLIGNARQEKRITMTITALAFYAQALSSLRDRRRATEALSEALQMAGPENYARIFLDMGEPMQELLQRLDLTGSAWEHAQRLIKRSDQPAKESQPDSSLSEREYEVLQLMASGMSNQEIAETLIVAVSTVKVHVRHVCQKLDVQRRMQAVARARALGLL